MTFFGDWVFPVQCLSAHCVPSPARSWLQKMQVAKKVLVDDPKGLPDLDTLANAFIYLQVRTPGCPHKDSAVQQHFVGHMQVGRVRSHLSSQLGGLPAVCQMGCCSSSARARSSAWKAAGTTARTSTLSWRGRFSAPSSACWASGERRASCACSRARPTPSEAPKGRAPRQ